MKNTQFSINARGIAEIKAFLAKNHKNPDAQNIDAWVDEAEFQISEGNSASIEIKSCDSVHGFTQEYTITDDGLDKKIVEIDE